MIFADLNCFFPQKSTVLLLCNLLSYIYIYNGIAVIETDFAHQIWCLLITISMFLFYLKEHGLRCQVLNANSKKLYSKYSLKLSEINCFIIQYWILCFLGVTAYSHLEKDWSCLAMEGLNISCLTIDLSLQYMMWRLRCSLLESYSGPLHLLMLKWKMKILWLTSEWMQHWANWDWKRQVTVLCFKYTDLPLMHSATAVGCQYD